MHTQNNDNLPENNHHDQGLNIGRAIVAWLVAAVLAVTFAAFASFEAQAAPFGSMSLEFTISRDSEFILLAVAAAAVFAVIFIMWRDVARQADRSLRERGHY